MDRESFLKTKAMELPRNVVVGHDALHAVGEVCQSLKLGKRALIVADETTMKIAGTTVEMELTARKIRSSEFLIPDATMKEIREGEEKIRKGNIDFALGVGGGRSIDVAKCASFNAGVPFVSVPTAASHDGVVSSRASIQKDGEKVSLAAQTPIAVIMDTAIIAESPFRLLAAGCGDIISNLVAVKDWALARNLRNEYYSSYAAALSELAARLVIENASTIKPRLEESAWFVCKALVSSGVAMSIAGSSRPASGSEHKFSHALDRLAKKPALHGEQCGVGDIEAVGRVDDAVRDAIDIDREIVLPEVGLQRPQSMDEGVSRLRETDPRHLPRPIHTDRIGKVDEPWTPGLREDVVRAQVR